MRQALWLPFLLSLLVVGRISSAQVFDRQSYNVPGKAGDFASADLNRDGKPDIVTTDETGNKVTVFLNNGSGNFANGGTQAYAVGDGPGSSSPRRVVSADFNGDGFADVVTANC